MSDIEAIKSRIHKLMAYANDGQASDGEIENAMGHAARLIDAHHLNHEDFTKKGKPDYDETPGLHYGKTGSSKFHGWEGVLARSICHLFGCVQHYIDNGLEPIRINGVVQMYSGKFAGQRKMSRRVAFYGPVMEAREAAELFEEWTKSIATMGVLRWGGAYRGEGESYCLGFATSLQERSLKIDEARQLTAAMPLKPLLGQAPSTTAITLTGRYDLLKAKSSDWLEKDKGVKLGSRSRATGGRSSSSAFSEGRSHGAAAEFNRKVQRRMLPGS